MQEFAGYIRRQVQCCKAIHCQIQRIGQQMWQVRQIPTIKPAYQSLEALEIPGFQEILTDESLPCEAKS
jgi:hypothetical protein